MPRRQLPWASKAGPSRTQTKTATKAPRNPAKKLRVRSDIDDDFFSGTILASNKKGKERAVDPDDDDLSDLAVESKTPRTNLLRRGPRSEDRAPSSSPPPIADIDKPTVEPMRKGVSKFDLRDDEWMMVEDEFLETAKLFTRHLHIAEYERLKETIEAKKKEAEIPRPVVPNAKLSSDGATKERARVQEKRQREAIRDVFASQDEDEENLPSTRASFGRPVRPNILSDSDGEDLDAMKPPPRRALLRKPEPTAVLPHPTTELPPTPSTSRPTPRPTSLSTASSKANPSPGTTPAPSFKKPAAPLPTTKPRTRPARATPFDMLDEYIPKKTTAVSKPKEEPTSPTLKTPARVSFSETSTTIRTPTSTKSARSIDMDDWGGGKTPSSVRSGNDVADRLAKRKADRDKADEEEKHKTVKLDDIPTFLF
ncbi:hypothetical protein NX059_006637 [Plenodomus lindquistii]|nr:hypothetical protein NX059_006637 [Plenodomus lindquistii]